MKNAKLSVNLLLLLCLFLLLPACNSDEEDPSVDGDVTDGDVSDGDATDGDVSDDDEDSTSDGDTQEDGDDEPSDGDNPLPDGDEDGDDPDGDEDIDLAEFCARFGEADCPRSHCMAFHGRRRVLNEDLGCFQSENTQQEFAACAPGSMCGDLCVAALSPEGTCWYFPTCSTPEVEGWINCGAGYPPDQEICRACMTSCDDLPDGDEESEAEGLYHVIDSDPVDGDVELGEGCEDWEATELGEGEEAPQWQLTSLWRESEIVPCTDESYGELPSSSPWQIWGSNEGWALAAWSDGADVVLFGDEQGLWRYEESPTPTLRCDPTTPGTVYTLQGTGTGNSAVVWAGLTGQVARLENNEWTVETLPAPLSGPVLALAVDGTRVAAQTLEGVAVRQATGWEAVTGCESFGIAFPDSVAVEQHQAAATGLLWHDNKLYVGATETLVEIDPAAHTCKALCMDVSIEDNEEIRFAVQGKAGCGIWVMTNRYIYTDSYSRHWYYQPKQAGICTVSGLWYPQATLVSPDRAEDDWLWGITGKGQQDRLVWGSYALGIDDQTCTEGMTPQQGWFLHNVGAWPEAWGRSNDLDNLGSYYYGYAMGSVPGPYTCEPAITPIRPAQLFVTGHVGYYSPGFSKVTFGE